jgi:hypothetical protein
MARSRKIPTVWNNFLMGLFVIELSQIVMNYMLQLFSWDYLSLCFLFVLLIL